MATITFDQLGELPDEHVDTLIARLTGAMSASAATSPRVAQVFAALRAVATCFDTVLRALDATRLRQHATLERMDRDLG